MLVARSEEHQGLRHVDFEQLREKLAHFAAVGRNGELARAGAEQVADGVSMTHQLCVSVEVAERVLHRLQRRKEPRQLDVLDIGRDVAVHRLLLAVELHQRLHVPAGYAEVERVEHHLPVL